MFFLFCSQMSYTAAINFHLVTKGSCGELLKREVNTQTARVTIVMFFISKTFPKCLYSPKLGTHFKVQHAGLIKKTKLCDPGISISLCEAASE